ncbi:MAG TPA: hypothetical protein VFQ44_27560 [Streptosporangiaceae bacterium]|nr:hypothetical protein [Streptosporangiaceae bacterium]
MQLYVDPSDDSDLISREMTCRGDEKNWLELVCQDEPLTLAVDALGAISSSSQPSLMAAMLQSLRCSGGERVLEIGTGSGYNAALLCHGLLDELVASVDIDAALVDNARSRLSDVGYFPDLASADGEAGYQDAAPYDRLVATCSVARVPLAWLSQTNPGGFELANLYRALGAGALVLLRIDDRGDASGHFEPYRAESMPSMNVSRAQAVRLMPEHYQVESAESRPTDVTAATLGDDAFGMLAALSADAQQFILLSDDRPEELCSLARMAPGHHPP